MTKDRGDPRAFYDPPPPDGSTFRIAWVTGSASQIISSKITRRLSLSNTPTNEDFCKFIIGSVVQASLKTINKKPVEIFQYTIIRGRSLDNLAALHHALDRVKPDLIIFGVNIFNLYVDSPITQAWRNVFLGTDLSPRVTTPSDIEFQITRNLSTISERRYDLARKLEEFLSIFPTGADRPEPDCKKLRRRAAINGQKPLDMKVVRRNVIGRGMPTQNQSAVAVFDATLALADKSGVPAIFYTEPINPGIWKDADVSAIIDARLEKYQDQREAAKSIIFVDAEHALDGNPSAFLDHSHLNNGDELALILLKEIAAAPGLRANIRLGVQKLMGTSPDR